MSSSESLIAGALSLWVAASAWYAFRLPGARRILRPINRVQLFARWTMFGAEIDGDSPPTTLEIEYRDSGNGGAPAPWRPAFPGYPARWAAFFWLPERRVRRRLEDLANEIKRDFEQAPPVQAALDAKFAILERYLAESKPLAPDVRREIRIVERLLPVNPRALSDAARGLVATTSAETVVLTHRVSFHA